ncbi:MAG: hypothetical protein JKY25_09430 [Robiginitomaculum sp.]|nr:hypothetical protein [Robiginitomaculum sp.]
MKKISSTIAILFFIASTALSGCAKNTASLSKENEVDCNPPIGWNSLVDKFSDGGIYIFGERHGTQESPELVVEFACAVAKRFNTQTIVLYELPDQTGTFFEDMLNAPTQDVEEFIGSRMKDFWTGNTDIQDGRSSQAMMKSLVRLKTINNSGIPLTIGHLQLTPKQQVETHEKIKNHTGNSYGFIYNLEAQNIHAAKEKYENVIVLVGSYHAKKHIQYFKSKNVKQNYIGLRQAYSAGTDWTCRETSGCGRHKAKAYRGSLLLNHKNRSVFVAKDQHSDFEGFFLFSTITASPPYVAK